MQSEQNGKKLYHVQSITDYSEDTIDYFIWADHFPTEQDVRKVITNDFDDGNDERIEDIFNNHNVYSVYAEEL